MSGHTAVACVCLSLVLCGGRAIGEDRPYFVTYDDHVEEAGGVEVSALSTSGFPRGDAGSYFAPWLEFEYGATSHLTTELYLEGVGMHGQGAFTGWRIEGRYRLFEADHVINPVLYVEYEHLNEATRIEKEIVGAGALSSEPLSALTATAAHEFEARVILSSQFREWNVSENLILERNISASEGVEFGYSGAVSRSFRAWSVGLEAYGGLGSTLGTPSLETRHFVAPVVGWRTTKASMIKVSLATGVTGASDRFLLRVGYSVDVR